jgi:hypothetical protein
MLDDVDLSPNQNSRQITKREFASTQPSKLGSHNHCGEMGMVDQISIVKPPVSVIKASGPFYSFENPTCLKSGDP